MYNPSVSVLICTRDRPDQLIRCLKSVFQLNYTNFEIVVVDNGSKKFSVPDLDYPRRTRFFSQPIPGLSYARNLAARQSEGEIVAFIDDDAVAQPDWLNSAIVNFATPIIACVTGRVLPLELKTEWQKELASLGWFPDSEVPMEFDASNFDPMVDSPGIGCNFFVRRSIFSDYEFSPVFNVGTPVGGEDERYLFHMLINAGWHIFYQPAALVYHEYVATREEFERKVVTYTTAHVAYTLRFLFSEKGTARRVLRRIFSSDKGSEISSQGRPIRRISSRLVIKARIMAPIALLRSALLARKRSPLASKQNLLLAEFAGR